MVALDLLEQQRADEVLRLEIAYSNLYQAYVSGDVNRMKYQFEIARQINIPHFAQSILFCTQQVMLSQNVVPTTTFPSIYNLMDENEVFMNIQGCLNALHKEMSARNIYQTRYTYAHNILYRPNRTFRQEEVLHQDTQGHQLKVADLLAVSKYAASVAEAIDPSNEEYAKANAAITVFQGIDAILNNKPEDRPVNKMLHLATSFLSSVVKASLKDKEAKRGVTIAAITLDLVIDFFCKK